MLKKHFDQILLAISKLKHTKLIFTYPNSDTYGKIIIKMIKNFIASKKNDELHSLHWDK